MSRPRRRRRPGAPRPGKTARLCRGRDRCPRCRSLRQGISADGVQEGRDGGGKYIVGGGRSVAFYGEPPKRIAIMVFESLEKAEATFNSEAYRAAKAAGDKVATFRIYAVEGIPQ
ncbi:MAG: DUF1330 domain-containing protein [Reyranella sp.]|nr:DUF1330 domain-containing protein [Reyranella sp.]